MAVDCQAHCVRISLWMKSVCIFLRNSVGFCGLFFFGTSLSVIICKCGKPFESRCCITTIANCCQHTAHNHNRMQNSKYRTQLFFVSFHFCRCHCCFSIHFCWFWDFLRCCRSSRLTPEFQRPTTMKPKCWETWRSDWVNVWESEWKWVFRLVECNFMEFADRKCVEKCGHETFK